MTRSHGGSHAGQVLARSIAALLVTSSIGFGAPASAAPSDNGDGQGAQGQAQAAQAHAAHAPSAQDHSTQAHSTRGQSAQGHARGRAGQRAGTGSSVSLPRPNDFGAQSDPDGMENGGVDQPGGQGGVDTTSQDGNNGSGNDTDCEDDNNGVGVPGHCKDGPDQAPPLPGPLVQPDQLVAGLSVVAVSAPETSVPAGGTAESISRTTDAATALPNTGAGAALPALAIAALAALVLGAGLVRSGRRPARVSS